MSIILFPKLQDWVKKTFNMSTTRKQPINLTEEYGIEPPQVPGFATKPCYLNVEYDPEGQLEPILDASFIYVHRVSGAQLHFNMSTIHIEGESGCKGFYTTHALRWCGMYNALDPYSLPEALRDPDRKETLGNHGSIVYVGRGRRDKRLFEPIDKTNNKDEFIDRLRRELPVIKSALESMDQDVTTLAGGVNLDAEIKAILEMDAAADEYVDSIYDHWTN